VGSGGSTIDAKSSDAELLHLLRIGNTEAYTELWRRHVRAALRVGRRVAPGQAEDLVSESFLAVYQQVTTTDCGPESAFRAYLFTVMRNTAVRWQKAGRLVETDPDLDDIVFENGLSWVEDREESADLLAAFEDMPERWQRVLWLSEVEDVGRGDIAAHLGIKPNAVSALLKRARAGLRLSWLTQQVPEPLRSDPEHVAMLLPPLMLHGKLKELAPRQQQHLTACRRCAEVESDLRSAYRRMQHGSLGASGFAALGIALPAATPAPASVVAASTSLLSFVAIAASVTLVVATGAVTTGLLFTPSQPSEAETQTADQQTGHSGQDHEGEAGRSRGKGEGEATGADPVAAHQDSGEYGRYNEDPRIEGLSVMNSGLPTEFYEPPARPETAQPGSLPQPADSPSSTALRSGISNPVESSGYLAPVLRDVSDPGVSIAIEFERRTDSPSNGSHPEQFVTTADDAGAWSFDLRPVHTDYTGTLDYRVWAFSGSEVSPADRGSFTLSSPSLLGFENLDPFDMMSLAEASSTGIVFHASGPSGGTICLTSIFPGQTVEFSLDSAGSAVQRIRFLNGGTYFLEFRACEGGHRGPATVVFVDVEGEGFSPFGFGSTAPEDTVFELTAS